MPKNNNDKKEIEEQRVSEYDILAVEISDEIYIDADIVKQFLLEYGAFMGRYKL